MNKIFLIGNLTKDVDLGQTNNGIYYAKFSIAVNRPFTNKEEKKTDYFNVVVWRTLAENCAKFLTKGKKVAIIGSLQTNQYETADGSKRISVEIQCSDVEFLSPKENNDSGNRAFSPLETDEDIPF